LVIISNSGRNAVPIEMAVEAQGRGISVIAVTSLAYSRLVSSRQRSGKKLYEIADVVIDNCAPHGDAVVKLPGVPQPVGPLSTVTGAAVMHAMMVGVAERLVGKMDPVPIFWSGNLDGVWEKNHKMMDPTATACGSGEARQLTFCADDSPCRWQSRHPGRRGC